MLTLGQHFYTMTPLRISHSTSSMKGGKEGASALLFIQCHKPSVVHCLVVMIKRCTALWKLVSL